MSNGRARESRSGSARLPLALILLTVAGVAGLLLWLSFAPPPPARPVPSVRVAFGAPTAPKAKPETPPPPPPAAKPAPSPPAITAVPPPGSDSVPAAPGLAAPEPGGGLAKAPEPGLFEPSPHGPLPIVGRDGREAWRVYARPFDAADRRPRIALVLYGLGMDAAATRAAIRKLPGEISLAFAPYAEGLDGWVAKARAAGHEALIMVPMESADFPISDPGPRALLTTLSAEKNRERLEWALGRATGYVGITDYLGSRFTASSQHLHALFQALRKRGLMYLAGRRDSAVLVKEIAGPMHLPYVVSTLHVDKRATRGLIDAQLLELERLARSTGRSVGMGFPYPITIERLAEWAGGLEKRGFVLAPVSALAVREES